MMTKTAVRQMLIQHKKARGAAKGALTKRLQQIALQLCFDHSENGCVNDPCRGCVLDDELYDRRLENGRPGH